MAIVDYCLGDPVEILDPYITEDHCPICTYDVGWADEMYDYIGEITTIKRNDVCFPRGQLSCGALVYELDATDEWVFSSCWLRPATLTDPSWEV